MKKIVFGIAGVIAMTVAANAVDTAQIKAACQSSNKTLWVERNQVCIPANPCDNPNFNQYCNRDFSRIQLENREYEAVVNYYADVNNVDCKAVPTDSKLVGQDYVICMGKDVLVFEFDDINDHGGSSKDTCLSSGAMEAVCITLKGSFYRDGNVGFCDNSNETACHMADKHFSFGDTLTNGDPLPFTGWNEGTCSIGCPGRNM